MNWYHRLKKRINDHLSRRFSNRICIAEESDENKALINIEEYFTYSQLNHFYYGPKPYWMSFNHLILRKLFVNYVNHVNVIDKGIIVNQNGFVILESTIAQKQYLDKLKSNHKVAFRHFLPYKKIDKAIVLSNYLSGNYFHWILENLSRLILLDPAELKKHKIILSHNAPQFAIDSLIELFGIKPKMIHLQNSPRIKVKEILIPSFPITHNLKSNWTNIYNPGIIRAINKVSMIKTNNNVDGKKRNFIISRRHATMRRIINESLLLDHFKVFEFEIIVLENYSFKEQMELFRNSNIVIGTHGAGLTNLIFAKNPLVIELFPSNRYNRDAIYFYQISNALNIEHHTIEYEATNKKRQDLVLELPMIHKIFEIINNSSKSK